MTMLQKSLVVVAALGAQALAFAFTLA